MSGTNTLVINLLELPSWSRMKMLTVLWASVVLTLAFTSLQASAQPGFLSIDCGASAPYVDSRNISWVPDTSYMTLGSIANVTLPSSIVGLPELSTLRYFPDATRKRFCYLLPSKVGQTYMVRPRFYHGVYDSYPTLSFNVTFETYYNTTFSFTPIIDNLYQEFIAVATTTNMQLCVVRTSAVDTPFISSIEMRLLDSGMYTKVQDGSGLAVQSRANYGAGQADVVRYPDDAYDRQWFQVTASGFQNLTSTNVVNSGFAPDKPPPAVMNSALALPYSSNNPIELTFRLSFVAPANSVFYLALYFAELQSLIASDVRIMDIYINGQVLALGVNVFSSAKNALYVPIEVATNSTPMLASNNITIAQALGSTLGPSINAAELNYIFPFQPRTPAGDISAIESIKTAFNLATYTGDPCLPIPYEWLSCTSTSPPRVSSVLLSKYNLTGPIPSTLASLTNLTTLYLDNNALTGEIPDLSKLTMLKLLHLENNALTGSIPDWLMSMTSLQGLYLQNNQLSGNVPKGLFNNSALTVVVTPGNAGLCINTTCSASSKSNVGAVAGGVAGGILVIAIAMILIYCLCLKKKTPSYDEEDASSHLSSNRTKYTLAQVNAATNNNARLLGRGGFGPVYYGKLPGGQEVAVKVSAKGSAQGTREFLNEVELLTRVHHKNLVSLVGYCQEGDRLILLYEYMPNGTVQEHLYGGPANGSGKVCLDWKTRLNIALNAAQGLEYLHVGCSPAIFHRDVKSNNILLTKDWVAKVADFGLSKSTNSKENVTHVSTMVKGTIGYLDPDYFNTNQLTDKSDVYSFGIVLLELICGRAPFNPDLPEDQRRLDQWVRPHLQANNIQKIVDPELGGNYNVDSMWKVADLAMTSVEPKSVHRPKMSVICQELRDALNLESSSGPVSIKL